jgi:rRNA biogenesis protein RRP5
VALALPNNLTGFIPLTSISDQLTTRIEKIFEDEGAEDSDDEVDDLQPEKLFTVGQYLRAYVTSTADDSVDGLGKGKRRIELSTNPRLANSGFHTADVIENNMVQASVVSVEDHGLVMDLGLEDSKLKGFMSKNELAAGVDYSKIQEGSVFLCMVTGLSSNGKIVKLSADPQKIGNLKKGNFLTEAPTVDAFLPGVAVEMLISEVSTSGLVGKIMGTLDVTADLIHSGAGESLEELDDIYKAGSKVKARVLCTFPKSEEKRVGVSLLDHVLHLSTRIEVVGKSKNDPLKKLPLSSIVEEAEVVKVESGKGLFLNLGVKGVSGFAHISKISDKMIETLSSIEGPYRPGTKHRCRVIGYNPMDGMYIVSLEKKVLEQPFLRIEDLPVGGVVKGKIDKIIINEKGVAGLIVSVSDGMTGLVPDMHMADVALKHAERKFKEGMTVTARVLSIDPDHRQFRLSLKKTLVNSDAPAWTDYDSITPGSSAPGTIINILPTGAVVQFYGPVRGFLPISEMSETYVKDPNQHFRVGQTVTVRALAVDTDEKKLQVSCKEPSATDTTQQSEFSSLKIGSIVSGTVAETTSDIITLDLVDTGLKALLRQGHLTDGSEAKNMSAMKRIRVGQKLHDLVVLDKTEKKNLVVLSNKPSLVKAARSGSLIKSFEDLKKDQEVCGFVRNITSDGVFVQFANGLVGLMLRSQVAADMLKQPDFGLRRDQSITAKVFALDPEQKRFLLTLRDSSEKEEKKKSTVSDSQTLVNPVDKSYSSLADIEVGKQIKVSITSVKATQLNVRLSDNIQGRIDASEAFEKWDDIKDRKHPLGVFKPKQVLSARVLGIHDARNHRFLPISHRAGKVPVFELSTKLETTSESGAEGLTLAQVKPGSSWIAFVNNIHQDCLWVNLSPNIRGRISLLELSNDVSRIEKVEEHHPVGSALRVWVKKVDSNENRLDLSTKPVGEDSLTIETISKGMILPGRVTKVTDRQLVVQLNENLIGKVPLTELADDFSQANPHGHSKNAIVRVCVVDVDQPNKTIILSIRPSKVLSSSLTAKDPSIASISRVKVNDVYRGFVTNVSDKGIFVRLSHNVTAFVRISDLSDAFIKDWKSAFQVDQLVKGKVIDVDADVNHVLMTLKESVIDKNYQPPVKWADLKPGEVVTGKVRKVVDYGVFVVVDNSHNVSGLCHRSEIADGKVGDVSKLYEEGDAVKAMILKIQPDKQRVSFGLKASYFEDDVNEGDSSDEDMLDDALEAQDDSSDEEPDSDEEDINLDDVRSVKSDESEEADDDMDVDEKEPAGLGNGLTTSGFDWTGDNMDLDKAEAEDGADSDEEDATKKKKKRRPEIKQDKTGDLDKYGPRSVADYERQLLGQPNSSSLWIQYMAFQLQLNEIDKARAIAERALKTIHIREEEEKMNVWIALLNLENTFGTDESVEEVFKRGCQYNDAKEMHEKLASIYIDSEKLDVSPIGSNYAFSALLTIL